MINKIIHIGISHETAPVEVRSLFVLSEDQKKDFITVLKKSFSIKAFFILNTCNRAEIYLETRTTTPANEVKEKLIDFVETIHSTSVSSHYVQVKSETISTVQHLFQVANGLNSGVKGDKQIINQVKNSYQKALKEGNQGSLLERAFQAVFRSHKRIIKETSFKSGSTSTAYSSLKLIEDHFGKIQTSQLSVLIIGAGEIAQDLIQYLPKFTFNKVAITNRTFGKAQKLAHQHDLETYAWDKVTANFFSTFDVIITGVSHQKHLISSINKMDKQRLWIDLAMPENINPNIADKQNAVFNIDQVVEQINTVAQQQKNAIPYVEQIIFDEIETFTSWLKKAEIRAKLLRFKNEKRQSITKGYLDNANLECNAIESLVNQSVRKYAQSQNLI